MLKRSVQVFGLMALSLTTPLAVAAESADQKQCTLAIAESQKSLREIVATNPRDKDKLQQQIAMQDKLIQDGRRNGLTECEIWAQVLGAAFRS